MWNIRRRAASKTKTSSHIATKQNSPLRIPCRVLLIKGMAMYTGTLEQRLELAQKAVCKNKGVYSPIYYENMQDFFCYIRKEKKAYSNTIILREPTDITWQNTGSWQEFPVEKCLYKEWLQDGSSTAVLSTGHVVSAKDDAELDGKIKKLAQEREFLFDPWTLYFISAP